MGNPKRRRRKRGVESDTPDLFLNSDIIVESTVDDDMNEKEKFKLIDELCTDSTSKINSQIETPIKSIQPSNKINLLFLYFIMGLSCVVSTWLTVDFVFALRGENDWVALSLGILWEASKYTFGSMALIHKDLFMKFILSTMSVVLIFGSVLASMGYLGELDQEMLDSKMSDNIAYQDYLTERNAIKKQIEILEISALEDTRRLFRRRALETNKKIDILKEKYVKLGKEIVKLEVNNYTPKSQSNILYIILSLMLELCGIVAISLISSNKRGVVGA